MVDVVSDQTEISYGNTGSPAFLGDSFSANPDIKVEGDNSQECALTASGANDVYVSGTWNIQNKHLRLYINLAFLAYIHNIASDGIQVYASDGTNTAYWTLEGADTYSGGWLDLILDIESTPTSGSVNSASVTSVGLRVNTNAKPRNVPANTWLDNWRFGNGLTINSTTSEQIDFYDVAVEDGLLSNKYNILALIKEEMFAHGELILGDTGSKNCNLYSVNEQITFANEVVSSTLYKIKSQQGTGVTDIYLEGFICKSKGTSRAELDLSATINSLTIKSSTFLGMGTIQLPGFGTTTATKFYDCLTGSLQSGHTITGGFWESSSELTPNGATIDSLSVISCASTTGTIVINSPAEMSQLSDMVFDSNNRCIEITTAGIYSFNGHQFSNNTIQVNFSGTGTCEINPSNGCNIQQINCEATGGGTIQVNAVSYNFIFNLSTVPSPNYEWRAYEVTNKGSLVGSVEISGTGAENATESSQTISHTYSNQNIAIQIISNDYKESLTYYTLTQASSEVDINLNLETND
jgi:hypothetical protein